MSLKSGMFIFFKIFKKYGYNKFLLPVTQCKTFLPYSILNYSSTSEENELSEAMKAYLQRYKEQEQFYKAEEEKFNIGKKHLANIIGEEVQNLTQKKIDEAISYLFPSALFVPKSRPMLKPPEILYRREPPVPFDKNGKPFHYLFYTNTPNFYEILHEASTYLEELIALEGKFDESKEKQNSEFIEDSVWISQIELENLCAERLQEGAYNKFLEVFNALASHPSAYSYKNFIMKFRKPIISVVKENLIKPIILPNGIMKVLVERTRRKTSSAKVLVTHPGTGIVKINNRGIDYFNSIQSREQVLLPLIFTDMLKKVDVDAKVSGGGETGQSGAVRLGISKALSALVLPDVKLRMAVGGLLQPDLRKAERKKPGKKKARRNYTWLKR